ncbi:SDR family NAD(P)-dependent oxidoreductase [Streptomyces malaysiensis]|uniref:SDR family NAD(P)-dependent oxidoreductase n=1 Tax=Streptomyces malaysiensis subsp. samsunensis TaxID=459658 RepID=A0A9X2RUC5_STRMQ|nr:SDR family NAD(P)-dependent oxidoreductase [Streptomyces samsunensis]MCQ8831326.1 SDR family NAD(P)-dependent oxidoreductase [Streptomyces samsunensis]
MTVNESPVWFITGCSTGLGRALATAVLGHGHRAVVTARDPRQVADVVAGHTDRALALALDVTDKDRVAEAVGTAGARRTSTFATYGRQPGDPARASEAIIGAVAAEEPPLRLLLGKAAYDIAQARLDSLRTAFDTWREVTLGADYPVAAS